MQQCLLKHASSICCRLSSRRLFTTCVLEQRVLKEARKSAGACSRSCLVSRIDSTALSTRPPSDSPTASIARASSLQTDQAGKSRPQTVDDFVLQSEESWWATRAPGFLKNVYLRLQARRSDPLDASLRQALDRAAVILYRGCANEYPYLKLVESFGLNDHVYTWFKLTLLHIWMVLLRFHVSLERHAYDRVKKGLLYELWNDFDKTRLPLIEKELDLKLATRERARKLQALYLQTLLEYDEGFLDDDTCLAGAVWRCLYASNETIDPTHLNAVVKYIRSTVAYLDTLDVEDMLLNGVLEWKVVEAGTNADGLLVKTPRTVRGSG